ncbi:MAG: hypothetical protein JG718_05235 [Candidatus Thiothrix moscowensis]|nr:hypothetical protein [Candidatus Thiothrix moscowensis]
MKSKLNKKLLMVGTCVLLLPAIANADKAAFEQAKLAKQTAKLEAAIKEAVDGLSPALQKAALDDPAFGKAVVEDLEKECKGKAKQDKACTGNYVNNLASHITRLISKNAAVANTNKKLLSLQSKQMKVIKASFDETVPVLQSYTATADAEFKKSLNDSYNKLPANEKATIKDAPKILQTPLFEAPQLEYKPQMKLNPLLNNSMLYVSPESVAYNLEQNSDINNLAESVVDFFIPTADAVEPVSTAMITTALIVAAAKAIEAYADYKTTPKQLDKTAICIDKADAEKKSCKKSAPKKARSDCAWMRYSWASWGYDGCVSGKEFANLVGCSAAHAVEVNACLILPQ